MVRTPEGAVGIPLRRARRERGLSLADAARALDVPEEYLTDLEDERLDAFGPEPHALAHLRIYARYLGVDIESAVPEQPDGSDGPPQPTPSRSPRRRIALIAAIGLLLVGALIAVTTVLVFEPDRDPLDGILSSEASQRQAAGQADRGGDGTALADGAAPADDTEVRARVTEPPTEDAQADDDIGSGNGQPEGADAVDGDDEPSTTEPAGPIGEGLRVQILDGSQDNARVAAARATLEALGYQIVFMDHAAAVYEQTTVLHGDDLADAAEALLAADGRFTTSGADPGLGAPADLHVIVGLDWPQD